MADSVISTVPLPPSLFQFADIVLSRVLTWAAKNFFAVELAALLAHIRDLQEHPDPENPEAQVNDVQVLTKALVVAEDRRFYQHAGVDSRGLFRAISVFIRIRSVQGASTITQQLVRVLTHDYRRKVARKLKEMCLACAIDRKVSKAEQAALYLRVGYFGWQMNGLVQASRRLRCRSPLSAAAAAAVVARLRYPEPHNPNARQRERIERRAKYIENCMNK